MKLIDTHCHIADLDFPLSSEEVLRSAKQTGVSKMLTIGTNEASSLQALEFARAHEGVWASVGVHPHDAKLGCDFLEQIALPDPKIVAVGEIGLDYHYDFSPRAVQAEIFRRQIEFALRQNLPIIFHVREAFDDFWKIVGDYKIDRAVVHSFSDSKENLEQIIKKGWFVGLNGIITFGKLEAQQALFADLPIDKILLETDAPYLSPVPLRGKVNQPAYVYHVAEFLAKVKGLSLEEIAKQTTRNAEELFSI